VLNFVFVFVVFSPISTESKFLLLLLLEAFSFKLLASSRAPKTKSFKKRKEKKRILP
jgi:hypothetical protein